MSSLALGLIGVPGAAAQDVTPLPVVDMSVTAASNPVLVAPPGTPVAIEVHVGQGAIPSSGTVTVQLPAQFSYVDGSSTGSCAGGPLTVTCPVTGTAQGEDFSVTAKTSLLTGDYTTSVSVAPSNPLSESLDYTANNATTVKTTVAQSSTTTDGQPAFAGNIPEQGSATVTFSDGRNLNLYVPAGSTAGGGVIVTIKGDDGRTRECQPGSPCALGFSVVFDESNPLFQAKDPNNPLVVKLTFGSQDPCRGLGSSSGCQFVPWFAKDPNAHKLEPVPFCPGSYPSGDSAGSGTMNPPNPDGTYNPCVNRRYHAGSSDTTFDVLLLSNDPLLDSLPSVNKK